MSTALLDADQLTLLKTAAEFRLLGLLLERPREGWAQSVAALAEETADPVLRDAACQAIEQNSISLYDSTFGPGGPAPLREVSYRRSVEPGAYLAELSACYDAFAYPADPTEPPDHIAVMLGFVSYLHLKQGYAEMRDDADDRDVARETAKHILDDHLSHIAHPLAGCLEQSGIPFLAAAGQSLRQRTPEPASRDIDSRLSVLEPESQLCCSDESDEDNAPAAS